MKQTAFFVVLVLLTCLCFGQMCPEQEFVDPNTCPFAVDPNMLAIDPVSGERLMLGCITVDVGRQWVYDGWGCDDDGNPLVFSASKGVVEQSGNVYTLRGTQTAIGADYIHISVTDVPMEHQTPLTRTGTLVVLAVQPNRPPTLCGGRP
jgi:hypothetical protein